MKRDTLVVIYPNNRETEWSSEILEEGEFASDDDDDCSIKVEYQIPLFLTRSPLLIIFIFFMDLRSRIKRIKLSD